jgi:probable F420-dependent oxidoreductase
MTPPRPFRFSLQVPRAASRREWVDLARRAEDTGFDMIVTADHLGGPAPLIPLAVAAEATERLRVGTLVLNNDFYTPSLLARDAATLDLLSDGRMELGLGAGHARPEYERAGLSFDPPGRRVDRLEESVTVLRRLFDGETVTHHGDHYHLAEESVAPRPVQARLPLLIGGGGDRVLGIGARLADAVGFTGLGRTLEDGHHHEPTGFAPWRVDEQVARVRREAGERLGSVELQVLVQAVVVTQDPVGAAEDLIAEHLGSLSVDDVLATPYLMVGSVWELIDRLTERRERWGFTHYTVRPDALGQIEGIMAALR